MSSAKKVLKQVKMTSWLTFLYELIMSLVVFSSSSAGWRLVELLRPFRLSEWSANMFMWSSRLLILCIFDTTFTSRFSESRCTIMLSRYVLNSSKSRLMSSIEVCLFRTDVIIKEKI